MSRLARRDGVVRGPGDQTAKPSRDARWRAVLSVLLLSLAARLLVVAVVDPQRWIEGSDSRYYVSEGWRLARDAGAVVPPVAPLYAYGLALAWLPWGDAPSPGTAGEIPPGLLTAVRLGQVALSMTMLGATTWLAWRLAHSRRAALVTALGLGLGPAFVLEPFRILTETLALSLLALALAAWVAPRRTPTRALVAGVLFGLAALTRPITFGLPWLLALHAAWTSRAWRHALAMLAVLMLVVLPWVAGLRHATGRWWPQGFESNLWIGAVGDGVWIGSRESDRLRERFAGGPDDYLGEVARAVRERPLEWAARRTRNLATALARPHFASDIGGPAFFTALERWMAGDAGPGPVLAVLAHPSSVTKVVLYAAHWLALAAGGIGLWRARRRVPGTGPLIAVALYFVGVHVFLTALPRYLLPIQLPLWLGVGFVAAPPPSRGSPGGDA